MLQALIGQQETFLNDYHQTAVTSNRSDEEIIHQVIQYLDLSGEKKFILSAEETKKGKAASFPFDKEMISRDYDGAIVTHYTYTGQPFELESDTDEQPEW